MVKSCDQSQWPMAFTCARALSSSLVNYRWWWLINLLAYKICSLISFLSLLGVKQPSFRLICPSRLQEQVEGRGYCVASDMMYCNAHTGFLQRCVSPTDACSIVYDIHWMKTSHQKTRFALDRPSPMLDPIPHSNYTKYLTDTLHHKTHLDILTCIQPSNICIIIIGIEINGVVTSMQHMTFVLLCES